MSNVGATKNSRTHAFSLSRSTNPTIPPEQAIAASVLLNGLHEIATMSPVAFDAKEMALEGDIGFETSYTNTCLPTPSMSRVVL